MIQGPRSRPAGRNGVIGGQTQDRGPGTSTGAMHGEKRQVDGVNINFWRSS
jgi:hypothetical protein